MLPKCRTRSQDDRRIPFANYAAVIEHYDGVLRLGLDAREKADLQEFLKSL